MDTVNGGGGNDTLTGNSGVDHFDFYWQLTDAGVDRITDFEVGIDRIHVASWWGDDFTDSVLVANQLRSAAGASTASLSTHRFICNATTGDLYFDADGVGGAAAIKFAVLANHAALTFSDIFIQF